jgi:hypothetical protein
MTVVSDAWQLVWSAPWNTIPVPRMRLRGPENIA